MLALLMINPYNYTEQDMPSRRNDDCEELWSLSRLAIRRRITKAQSLGALFGLAGGIFSGLFGAAFTAASWFVANEGTHRWLSTIGTVLLFLTIPLLIFGGYCLDWMEKDKPQCYSKVVRYEDEDDDQGI
jgi:hypothetical protein